MAEEIKVLCPWCNKGEVYIEGAGKPPPLGRFPALLPVFPIFFLKVMR